MEAADLVIVNKADGSLLTAAQHTKADYSSAMQFVHPKFDNWQASVMLASAGTDKRIYEVLEMINKFHDRMSFCGSLLQKRAEQSEYWMQSHLHRQVMRLLTQNYSCQQLLENSKQSLQEGSTTPRAAASKVMEKFIQTLKS